MCVGPIIIIDESNRANPNIKCVDVTFQQIMMSVLGYNNRKSFYFSDSQSLIFFCRYCFELVSAARMLSEANVCVRVMNLDVCACMVTRIIRIL